MKQISYQENKITKTGYPNLAFCKVKTNPVRLLMRSSLYLYCSENRDLKTGNILLPKMLLLTWLLFSQLVAVSKMPAMGGSQTKLAGSKIMDVHILHGSVSIGINTDEQAAQSLKKYAAPVLWGINYAEANKGIDFTASVGEKKKISRLQIVNHKISIQDKKAILYWEVPGEENGIKYIIERSFNGVDFSKIGSTPVQLPGRGIYNFEDSSVKNIQSENFYYRIRLIEINKKEKLSYIMVLRMHTDNDTKLAGGPNQLRKSDNEIIYIKKPARAMVASSDAGEPVWVTLKITLSIRENIFFINDLCKFPQCNYFV